MRRETVENKILEIDTLIENAQSNEEIFWLTQDLACYYMILDVMDKKDEQNFLLSEQSN